MTTKIDTYAAVTDKILSALEAGTKPWKRGWALGGGGFPQRANGEYYRGINVLLLWSAAADAGYCSNRWLTFKQAQALGASVRKGEKGTPIVFFKKLEVPAQGAGGEEEIRKIPMIRTYTVFNAEQVDGLPANWSAPAVAADPIERDEAAEAALRSCGADIRESGDKAFYAPGPDFVNMPTLDRFETTGDHLTTLAHELCHWTGHKARLDRALLNQFGSKDYAFEELVAEIGAAFVCARLGVAGDHIDNHAAYLSSWLKKLRDDKRAIFKAATLAQAAADMVLAGASLGDDPDGPGSGEQAPADAAPVAEPARATQLAALQAASPLRPVAGRTASVDGLALFDHARQPELAL